MTAAAMQDPPKLRVELAIVGKKGLWLLRQLQAAGFEMSHSKLYGWLQEDPIYTPPTPEEWRAIRRILKEAGKGKGRKKRKRG